jgi:hypothetical protein
MHANVCQAVALVLTQRWISLHEVDSRLGQAFFDQLKNRRSSQSVDF